MPPIQVRDMTMQRRENDLVLATFGRGFYILDDYSALREITPQALAEEARLFPLRDAYLFNPLGLSPAGSAGLGPLSGLWAAPNPPFGAVFTYNVKAALPADATLVLTITDDTGRQIRRMDVDKTAGLRRVAWNLRADPPAGAPAGGRGAWRRRWRRRGFGGRGGAALGALVDAGHLSRHARTQDRRQRHADRAEPRRSGWWRYRNRLGARGSGLGARVRLRGSRGFRLQPEGCVWCRDRISRIVPPLTAQPRSDPDVSPADELACRGPA